MYSLNKTYQDHNLKIGVKNISENGGKTLMQVSDHYFTTQICIFLLLKQPNRQLFFYAWISSFQNEPVTSHKWENGGNVQLAELHSWRN